MCRRFFEIGYSAGRDDVFSEEREASEKYPENVVSLERFRQSRLLGRELAEKDA